MCRIRSQYSWRLHTAYTDTSNISQRACVSNIARVQLFHFQVAFSLKALRHVTGALMSSSHSCVSASKRELDYKKAAAALSWIRSSRELGPPRGQSRAR